MELGLRRLRRRLIRKVQKIPRQASSSHIVPTLKWFQHRLHHFTAQSWKKRQVKPEGDGDFPTMHHGRRCDISGQSQTVWCVKRPTRPPSESVHAAARSSRLEKRAPAASAGRRREFHIQSVSPGLTRSFCSDRQSELDHMTELWIHKESSLIVGFQTLLESVLE